MDVTLRALRPGEQPHTAEPLSEYDDFGPGREPLDPPPAALEENGSLGVVVDEAVVGTVSWRWLAWGPNVESRCPMIGISLLPPARGKGIGTRAQQLLVDLLFSQTTTNRIEAHTDVTNLAEQRALERAGFTSEGIVRGAQWRRGEYHDGHLYSILRKEWDQS